MKKIVCTLLAGIIALTLTACSGGSGVSSSMAPATENVSYSASSAADTVAQGKGVAGQSDGGEMNAVTASLGSLPANRKIIRHVSMRLETQTFDEAILQLRQIVADAGGYIEQENVAGRSIRNDSEYPRSAYIMARIPSEKLDGAALELSEISNVLERQESTDDVTEEYYDSEAHLKSLEIQEERLLAILEKAEKLEDVVSLERALSEVRYEIESITASIRHMDSQVAYSYLEINLDEVVTFTEVQQMPRSFGEELSIAAGNSMRRISDSLQSISLSVVEYGPVFILQLAVWVLFIAAVVWLLRWILRRFGVVNRFTMKRGKHIRNLTGGSQTLTQNEAAQKQEELEQDTTNRP